MSPSPGLHVFVSNRLDALAERLAQVLGDPLSSPLRAETVVIPNQGMARWLSLRLAERLGVWANFRFPFPDDLLAEAVRAVAPEAPDGIPFRTEVLTWRLMRHLPAHCALPGWEEPRNYLSRDERGLRRLQLSRRLAETLELYAIFRPEMLAEWETGPGGDWQAQLWRALAGEHPGAHKAALLGQLIARAPESSPLPGSLPERVSVFGVATLAPLRLRALKALSQLTEVNLFVVNPCKAYWGQIVSGREAARSRRREGWAGSSDEDLHLQVGNPLLASLGKLGRDFLDTLLETLETEGEGIFVDPGEGSLLACLQSDILGLRDRGADGARTRLHPEDRTVQIHSCHGPMREVEVLHDHLLDLFQTLPGLRPSDILVAAPDIEAYAPYITAVFDAPADPRHRIPYTLADRGSRAQSHALDAFLRLLDLHGSRFGVGEILDLLEIPDVLRRFGLSREELDVVRSWVEKTRIRWGIDAEDRRGRGLPAYEENSWRAGLRRLLLGYALPGENRRTFQGILPFDDVEGAQARALGCFAAFCERLFETQRDLNRPRTLAQWAESLTALADSFLAPDDSTERDVQTLRRELRRLADSQRLAGFDEVVDVLLVREHLSERLDSQSMGGGFLAGRVTFCSLRPLRSVPFRVIALLGMNDRAFPRLARPPGFDRMAQAPRRGDPSLRDEDRYLFLETLLSARERLYMSYVGQSIQDNSEAPPSAVVSELLDAVEQGFEHPLGKSREAIVTKHRLQAFSPSYFLGEGPLFTYSVENCNAVAARLSGVTAERPFVPGPLPPASEDHRTVNLQHLACFLASPAQFFANQRLGIRLPEDADAREEEEPFEVSGLAKFHVQEALVASALAGRDPEEDYAILRAQGLLPPARPGEVTFHALAREVAGFAERVRPYVRDEVLEPLDVVLRLGEFCLVGRIQGIWSAGLVRYRCAKLKGKDLVRGWTEHLALQCAAAAGYPESTFLLGTDAGFRYGPVPGCREHLGKLVALYWQGLREPVRFFPTASLEYARRTRDPTKTAGALGAARTAWEGSDYRKGEREDPYYRLCFRDVDPLDGTFERLALEVLGPLLDHGEEL